ncbi:hypothetical protein Nepgr_013341 [Nepenthes gracilis]|uniref:Uncharacterized protein n=1 Tax=Nepenthes gracilis TaxID=150966 RepID=A0AAD3SIP9_NEPGR|nr:hypothetical protein Nepgr_013341 [Nepenthes gracilis]
MFLKTAQRREACDSSGVSFLLLGYICLQKYDSDYWEIPKNEIYELLQEFDSCSIAGDLAVSCSFPLPFPIGDHLSNVEGARDAAIQGDMGVLEFEVKQGVIVHTGLSL